MRQYPIKGHPGLHVSKLDRGSWFVASTPEHAARNRLAVEWCEARGPYGRKCDAMKWASVSAGFHADEQGATLIAPGVYADLSNADYHADPALSKSGMPSLLRSVNHYRARRKSQLAGLKRTKPLDLGTAIHELVLMGPAAFAEQIAVRPEVTDDDKRGNFHTKVGKAWRDEQRAAGLTVLSADDVLNIERAADAVFSHPVAGPMVEECVREQSHFWLDPLTGLRCRSREDMVTEDRAVLIDLKSAADASGGAMKKAVNRFGYHLQWAHYGDGIRETMGVDVEAFVVVAVELVEPFGVALYHLEEKWLEAGQFATRKAIDRLAEYEAHDEETDGPRYWGYPTEIQTLECPRWLQTH